MPQPNKILVYSDGASRRNPGPAAIGFAIYDQNGNLLEQNAQYIGENTNNTAEYRALLWAMDRSCAHCRKNIRIHSDSELVVKQMTGVYRAKKDHLRDLLQEALNKKALFESFEIVHVPRNNSRLQAVDKLVNSALDQEGF